MRDFVNNISIVPVIAPAVLAATTTSDPIDLKGFNGVAFAINSGAIVGAGDFTAKVQESDTTTSGDFIDATAELLIGTLPASLAAASVAKIGYRGHRRYVRLVLTKNGGTSIAAGVVAVRGHSATRPI